MMIAITNLTALAKVLIDGNSSVHQIFALYEEAFVHQGFLGQVVSSQAVPDSCHNL